MSTNVSIIIPVFNEERYIENCLNSIIQFTENIEEMELFVIDGGSNDGTLEIVNNFASKYPFIKVLHNKKQKIAPALNLGIKKSTGKYIIRLDAHAEFPPGYINKLTDTLDNSSIEIANVGGVIETKPGGGSLIAKSISIALSSKIGVGNSAFRTETINKPEYVSTVPWGAYRREALKDVGMFNERVPRSEDLELSQKLLASGRKILMIPGVKATLFSRRDILSLIKQQFDNGRGVTKENKGEISFYKLRHYIPFLFCLYLTVLFFLQFSPVLSLYNIFNLLALTPLCIYAAATLFLGTWNGVKLAQPLYIPLIPIVLLCIHLSYGIGSMYGILQFIFPSLPYPKIR